MSSESNTSLESYTISQIPSLSRKKLQALCKGNGIKANTKNIVLVQSLQRKLMQLHDPKRRATDGDGSKENRSGSGNLTPSSVNRTRTKLRRKSAKFTASTERTASKSKTHASAKASRSVSSSPSSASKSKLKEQSSSAKSPATTDVMVSEAETATPKSECDEQITDDREQLNFSKAECDADQAAADVSRTASKAEISCYYDSDVDLNESRSTQHNNNGSMIRMSDVDQNDVDDEVENDANEPETTTKAPFALHALQHDETTNIQPAETTTTTTTDAKPQQQQSPQPDAAVIVAQVAMEKEDSLEHTPQLNESIEMFIRSSLSKNHSLQPTPQYRRAPALAFDALQLSNIAASDDNDADEDDYEEDDDVDMVTTPALPEKRDDAAATEAVAQPVLSLEEEIGTMSSLRRQQRRQRTPLLNVCASRISVDESNLGGRDKNNGGGDEPEEEDDDDDDAEMAAPKPEASKSESPEWKHTPLKALPKLNKHRESLSNDQSEQQIQEDDQDFRVTAIPIVSEENRELLAAAAAASNTEQHEKPTAMQTPKPLQRLAVKPKSELKLKDDSTSISMTFGDGQRFEFKSIYSPSKSQSVSKIYHTLGSDDNETGAEQAAAPAVPQQQQQYLHNKSRPSKEIGQTPQQEVLSEKTMAIRQMMEDAERELTSPLHTVKTIHGRNHLKNLGNNNAAVDASRETKSTSLSMLQPKRDADQPQQKTKSESNEQRRKSLADAARARSPSPSRPHKKGMVPDWNAIHQKQVWTREPDLRQWDEAKKARAERLYGKGSASKTSGSGVAQSETGVAAAAPASATKSSLTSKKMSTPGLRQRSMKKKARGTHTLNTDQRIDRKRVSIMPSSNDHKFNHSKDSKLNRKVHRAPTPFKQSDHAAGIKSKQKVSVKPKFCMTLSEETSLEEEEEEGEEGEAAAAAPTEPQKQQPQPEKEQETQASETETEGLVSPNQEPDGGAKAEAVVQAPAKTEENMAMETDVDVDTSTDSNTNAPKSVDSTASSEECSADEKQKHTSEKDEEKEKPKVPRKKLAFDPNNVRSKLFSATKASNNKTIPKKRRLSQTPLNDHSVKSKKNIAHTKMVRDWSAVRSKVDTGRSKVKPTAPATVTENKPEEEATQIARDVVNDINESVTSGTRVAGVKRKLTWAPSDSNAQQQDEMSSKEPQQKKRRMSQQTVSSKRWQ